MDLTDKRQALHRQTTVEKSCSLLSWIEDILKTDQQLVQIFDIMIDRLFQLENNEF